MDIQAAIFDFDGTIVDSMPMWYDVFPGWLTEHGITNALALSEQYEYLSFEEEVNFFQDEFGLCASHEEALAEMHERVLAGYAHQAELFPGAREFLATLRATGVPMVILSSTSTGIVRQMLATYDLDQYFSEVYNAEELGSDKKHPEVYHAVRERLGTPVETTWVFEDAPFGVATAHGAGYPTVCLINDHDGRDEAFLQDNCDILIHSWPELTLARMADYERPLDPAELAGAEPLKVLVIGGSPEPSSPELVARLAAEADYVIAADRGAEVLRAAGVTPSVYCGDSDTASPETAAWAKSVAARSILFPAEKYVTDLAIALDCARHEAARQRRPLALTATCVSGGRPDHALGVLGNLLSALGAAPRVVEDAGTPFECRLLSPAGASTWELGPAAEGRTFSAIALTEDTMASESGLAWELDHQALPLLGNRTLSNRVTSPDATVTCHSGTLACFLFD